MKKNNGYSTTLLCSVCLPWTLPLCSPPHVSHNNKPLDSPVQYIPCDTQPTILTGPVYYLIHIDGGVRATRPLESSPHVRNVPANLHFSISTIFDQTVRG